MMSMFFPLHIALWFSIVGYFFGGMDSSLIKRPWISQIQGYLTVPILEYGSGIECFSEVGQTNYHLVI